MSKYVYLFEQFSKSEDEKEYNLNPKFCLNCDKPIEYSKRENKFCSKSCAVTYNNRNRVVSDEQKEKVSKSLSGKVKDKISICDECGRDFIVGRDSTGRLSRSKFCSDECSKKHMKNVLSVYQKDLVDKGIHQGWTSRNVLSYPEKFFIDVLDNNNLTYQTNFPINKRKLLGLNDDSNYFLDFYFQDKNIDLEIDGKQHEYEDRKESDSVRDSVIQSKLGIKIYRIKWKDITTDSGKLYIKNEINKFLDFYYNN